MRYAPGRSVPAALEDLVTVARLLQGFPGRWWVAGGWAIDAWAGGPSRDHDDVEISIMRGDQVLLRNHLPGWTLETGAHGPDGPRRITLGEGTWLKLPEFQLRVRRDAGDVAGGDGVRAFEVFLNDERAGQWVSRRHPTVTRAFSALILDSPMGMPVLAPEVQLLYKAKYHRPKDEHDFARALPHLSAAQRVWLRTTLEEYHAGDPWLAAL